MSKKDPVGSVLVAGGGITGMQAALDLADSGYYVYLVEKSPGIGGTMAQLDKTFPTMDCSICILGPKMADVGKHCVVGAGSVVTHSLPPYSIARGVPARVVGIRGEEAPLADDESEPGTQANGTTENDVEGNGP